MKFQALFESCVIPTKGKCKQQEHELNKNLTLMCVLVYTDNFFVCLNNFV